MQKCTLLSQNVHRCDTIHHIHIQNIHHRILIRIQGPFLNRKKFKFVNEEGRVEVGRERRSRRKKRRRRKKTTTKSKEEV